MRPEEPPMWYLGFAVLVLVYFLFVVQATPALPMSVSVCSISVWHLCVFRIIFTARRVCPMPNRTLENPCLLCACGGVKPQALGLTYNTSHPWYMVTIDYICQGPAASRGSVFVLVFCYL